MTGKGMCAFPTKIAWSLETAKDWQKLGSLCRVRKGQEVSDEPGSPPERGLGLVLAGVWASCKIQLKMSPSDSSPGLLPLPWPLLNYM